MNLAKIRQKSRDRKLLGIPEKLQANVSAEVTEGVAVAEAVAASELCCLANSLPLDVTFAVTTGSGQADVSHGLHESKTVKRNFDPVQVILEGRIAAGCIEEQQSEPEEILPVEVADYAEFLCVRISDELYGIDIMQIKEIIKPKTVTEVPRSPVFLPGIVSLRGVIIPVIDMLCRLGFSTRPDISSQRIVVVRSGGSFSGLLVDEVIQVVRILKDSIETAPAVLEGIDKEFVSGIGRYESQMVILLDLDTVTDLTLF